MNIEQVLIWKDDKNKLRKSDEMGEDPIHEYRRPSFWQYAFLHTWSCADIDGLFYTLPRITEKSEVFTKLFGMGIGYAITLTRKE